MLRLSDQKMCGWKNNDKKNIPGVELTLFTTL